MVPKNKAPKRRKIPPPQAPPTMTASQFEQMQTRQDAVINNNVIEGMEIQSSSAKEPSLYYLHNQYYGLFGPHPCNQTLLIN